MKCPILTAACLARPTGIDKESRNCLKEECAWWDEAFGLCAPLASNTALLAMGNVLGEINNELCLSRITFRCRDCGLTIARSASEGEALPLGWLRIEQIDGKYMMLCDACSHVEKQGR